MTAILLIETATEVCGVALALDNRVVAIREEPNCKSPIAIITNMIDTCLQEAGMQYNQLSAVAVSGGPGSYTGLRTGASVAKGLCFALDIPLISVDTLQALAWGAQQTINDKAVVHIPMLDARRNEVWLNAYDSQFNPLSVAQPLILEDGALDNYLNQFPGAASFLCSGNGVFKIKLENISKFTDICAVQKNSAQYLSYFAYNKWRNNQFEDIALFEPCYLKPPNITISLQPKFL